MISKTSLNDSMVTLQDLVFILRFLGKNRMSKKLLCEADLTIKDIAELVGYNNSHCFIKVFKEDAGITPGEYRDIYKT